MPFKYRPYSLANYQTYSVSCNIELVNEMKNYALRKRSNISVMTRIALREFLDKCYLEDSKASYRKESEALKSGEDRIGPYEGFENRPQTNQ